MIRSSFPALLAAGLVAGLVAAQDPSHKMSMPPVAPAGSMALALPTGDLATSSLLVEATAPARMAVGRAFEYQIKLTNLTKNLILEDILVRQELGEHLAIESAEPMPSVADKVGEKTWAMARLAPGESRSIKVHALGEQVGAASSCIRVTYQPSLCVTTEFIKPEVQIAKVAPARADLCDVIPARYVIKNTGTGAARGLKLRDELPDGLTTSTGAHVVEANVGDLAQGQTKELRVQLVAAKPGDFTSRATVQGQDEIRATSNQTTTALRMVNLAVKIAGPDAQYLGQAATYQVTVKNTGEVPAVATKLAVQADADLRIDRVSRASRDGKAPAVGTNNALIWDLGSLAPGAESVVSFIGVGRGKKELQHIATATAACARSNELSATATAAAKTDVIALPALRLEMVDDHDPVQVGQNVIYSINVLNQGQGDDRNVKIVCKLPEGLTYISSKGSTEGKADGQTITFTPAAVLGAKQQLNYTVTAKAAKSGDVRTNVEMSSDYLTTPDPETEPTRLVDIAAATAPK